MDVLLYRIFRPIIKLLMMVIFHPKYIGLDNIPKDGSIVLVGNHTNYLDCTLLISSTKRTIHFLGKDSLSKGVKGLLFKNMGLIFVNRSIHDKEALKKAIDVLKENKVIGIFPEGTINRGKDITLPFKIGSVKMAHDTNSYLVPFVITGKYKLFGGVRIEFLKPYKVGDNLTEENDKLRGIIEEKLVKYNGIIK